MPHLFRTVDGELHKPGAPISLTTADGVVVEGIWGGSAQVEKLGWWLKKPGHELMQTEEVSEIAIRDEGSGEIRWGAAPARARLLFVLAASPSGKSYRIAKMVTTAATREQSAYFNEDRFSLFGALKADGTINEIQPLTPPPPASPAQPELF
ncbi:MAG: hypothetical protein H7Y36_09395 [Armatimonadetes bacterium]|nr:hypothetical protein [Akkermansiaceae bacterium]